MSQLCRDRAEPAPNPQFTANCNCGDLFGIQTTQQTPINMFMGDFLCCDISNDETILTAYHGDDVILNFMPIHTYATYEFRYTYFWLTITTSMGV